MTRDRDTCLLPRKGNCQAKHGHESVVETPKEGIQFVVNLDKSKKKDRRRSERAGSSRRRRKSGGGGGSSSNGNVRHDERTHQHKVATNKVVSFTCLPSTPRQRLDNSGNNRSDKKDRRRRSKNRCGKENHQRQRHGASSHSSFSFFVESADMDENGQFNNGGARAATPDKRGGKVCGINNHAGNDYHHQQHHHNHQCRQQGRRDSHHCPPHRHCRCHRHHRDGRAEKRGKEQEDNCDGKQRRRQQQRERKRHWSREEEVEEEDEGKPVGGGHCHENINCDYYRDGDCRGDRREGQGRSKKRRKTREEEEEEKSVHQVESLFCDGNNNDSSDDKDMKELESGNDGRDDAANFTTRKQTRIHHRDDDGHDDDGISLFPLLLRKSHRLGKSDTSTENKNGRFQYGETNLDFRQLQQPSASSLRSSHSIHGTVEEKELDVTESHACRTSTSMRVRSLRSTSASTSTLCSVSNDSSGRKRTGDQRASDRAHPLLKSSSSCFPGVLPSPIRRLLGERTKHSHDHEEEEVYDEQQRQHKRRRMHEENSSEHCFADEEHDNNDDASRDDTANKMMTRKEPRIHLGAAAAASASLSAGSSLVPSLLSSSSSSSPSCISRHLTGKCDAKNGNDTNRGCGDRWKRSDDGSDQFQPSPSCVLSKRSAASHSIPRSKVHDKDDGVTKNGTRHNGTASTAIESFGSTCGSSNGGNERKRGEDRRAHDCVRPSLSSFAGGSPSPIRRLPGETTRHGHDDDDNDMQQIRRWKRPKRRRIHNESMNEGCCAHDDETERQEKCDMRREEEDDGDDGGGGVSDRVGGEHQRSYSGIDDDCCEKNDTVPMDDCRVNDKNDRDMKQLESHCHSSSCATVVTTMSDSLLKTKEEGDRNDNAGLVVVDDTDKKAPPEEEHKRSHSGIDDGCCEKNDTVPMNDYHTNDNDDRDLQHLESRFRSSSCGTGVTTMTDSLVEKKVEGNRNDDTALGVVDDTDKKSPREEEPHGRSPAQSPSLSSFQRMHDGHENEKGSRGVNASTTKSSIGATCKSFNTSSNSRTGEWVKDHLHPPKSSRKLPSPMRQKPNTEKADEHKRKSKAQRKRKRTMDNETEDEHVHDGSEGRSVVGGVGYHNDRERREEINMTVEEEDVDVVDSLKDEKRTNRNCGLLGGDDICPVANVPVDDRAQDERDCAPSSCNGLTTETPIMKSILPSGEEVCHNGMVADDTDAADVPDDGSVNDERDCPPCNYNGLTTETPMMKSVLPSREEEERHNSMVDDDVDAADVSLGDNIGNERDCPPCNFNSLTTETPMMKSMLCGKEEVAHHEMIDDDDKENKGKLSPELPSFGLSTLASSNRPGDGDASNENGFNLGKNPSKKDKWADHHLLLPVTSRNLSSPMCCLRRKEEEKINRDCSERRNGSAFDIDENLAPAIPCDSCISGERDCPISRCSGSDTGGALMESMFLRKGESDGNAIFDEVEQNQGSLFPLPPSSVSSSAVSSKVTVSRKKEGNDVSMVVDEAKQNQGSLSPLPSSFDPSNSVSSNPKDDGFDKTEGVGNTADISSSKKKKWIVDHLHPPKSSRKLRSPMRYLISKEKKKNSCDFSEFQPKQKKCDEENYDDKGCRDSGECNRCDPEHGQKSRTENWKEYNDNFGSLGGEIERTYGHVDGDGDGDGDSCKGCYDGVDVPIISDSNGNRDCHHPENHLSSVTAICTNEDSLRSRKKERTLEGTTVDGALIWDSSGADGTEENCCEMSSSFPLPSCQAFEMLSSRSYLSLFVNNSTVDGAKLAYGRNDRRHLRYGDVTDRVLRALLGAMGLEPVEDVMKEREEAVSNKVAGERQKVVVGVRLMSSSVKCKPAQTPSSVRDFALLQVSLREVTEYTMKEKEEYKQAEYGISLTPSTAIDQVAEAFRLAAHHCLTWYHGHGRGENDVSTSTKKKKKGETLRRAFMVLLASLRGLLVRMAGEIDDYDSNFSNDTHAMTGAAPFPTARNVFRVPGTDSQVVGTQNAADVDSTMVTTMGDSDHQRVIFSPPSFSYSPFSTAEELLLDIVPLLTQFVQPLGEKHASALFKNLLHLDFNFLLKKRIAKQKELCRKSEEKDECSKVKTESCKANTFCHSTVVVRNGLVEMFVRQLCMQERWDSKRLRRELGSSCRSMDGSAAALRQSASRECREACAAVERYREEQLRRIEEEKQAGALHQVKQEQGRRRKEKQTEAIEESWGNDPHANSGEIQRKVSISPLRTFSCQNDSAEEDMHLLRMDGCIYLSHIASRLMAVRLSTRPPASQASFPPRSPPTDRASSQSSAVKQKCAELGGVSENREFKRNAVEAGSKVTETTIGSSNKSLPDCEVVHPSHNEKNETLNLQRQQLCLTAYFFFHTLIETLSGGRRFSNTLSRRHLASAVLSCLLLAGKSEDCPVKIKTLLSLTRSVPLPPPPVEEMNGTQSRSDLLLGRKNDRSAHHMTSEKKGGHSNIPCPESINNKAAHPTARQTKKRTKMTETDTEKSNDATDDFQSNIEKWGEPTADLIKHYELKLLSIFGFHMPTDSRMLHPTAYLEELRIKLGLDEEAIDFICKIINDMCYTHSALCILQEPRLIVTASYYLRCTRMEHKLHPEWENILGEEEVTVKVIADYMWEVRKCAKLRGKQWKELKRWRNGLCMQLDNEKPPVRALASKCSPPDESNGDNDHDEKKQKALSSISNLSFVAPLELPREISQVARLINDTLTEAAEENSGHDTDIGSFCRREISEEPNPTCDSSSVTGDDTSVRSLQLRPTRFLNEIQKEMGGEGPVAITPIPSYAREVG